METRNQHKSAESNKGLSPRERITNIERPSTSDFWSAVATLRALVLSGADEKTLLAEVSKEVKKPKYRNE